MAVEPVHPFEQLASERFDALRHGVEPEPVVPGQHVVPGLWFVADNERGEIAGQREGLPGGLLHFGFDVRRPGRWLSMNMSLGGAPLAPGQALGLVLRTASEAPVRFHVRLRSGEAGGGFIDALFPGEFEAGPGERLVVAMLPAEEAEALVKPAPWRNLMVMFDPVSFRLRLLDARLFVTRTALAT